MSNYVLFGLLGLGAGAVYALLALGLVLEYRTTTVVNFAHGAMAMVIAYVYVELRSTGDLVLPVLGIPDRIPLSKEGLATAPSLAIALIYAALLGLLVYELVFRPLRHAPTLARVVASVGLMTVLQAGAVIKFGTNPRSTSAIFPNHTVEWFGARVPIDRYYLAGTAIVLAVALWAIYRFTRLGVATRAAAQDERGAAALGYSPTRLAAFSWMLATVLAGIAGILIVPITSLNPAVYTLFVVPALAACLVARFTSFAIVVIAGLSIGVSQSELGYLQTQFTWLPQGSQAALPFAVIVVGLALVGRRLPARLSTVEARPPEAGHPRQVTQAALVAFVAATAALYLFSGVYRGAVIQSLIATMLCLSVIVITGYVGQISLVQMGFAGVGGFTVSGLAHGLGVPFPVSLIVAGAVAAAVGVVLGLPALRIRGVQLAVVTFALAVTLDQFVFGSDLITTESGSEVPPLSLFGLDLDIRGGTPGSFRPAFGIAVLVILILLAVGVANVRRSPLGRRMLAVRANERGAAALGIDVARTKITAFAIAAFIAGCAGALIGYQQRVISGDSFNVFVSLQILAVTYIGGVARISGAVVAGVLMAPGALGSTFLDKAVGVGDYELLLGGLGLIAMAIFHRDGLSATIGRQLARLRRRSSPAIVLATAPSAPARLAGVRGNGARRPALEVESLSVQYGGIRAVDNVSFAVRPQSMLGLIGPNGAGKTSVVEAISGFVPSRGTVWLGGEPITGLPPHRRARLGLGRTFQAPQLFDDSSVYENLLTSTGVVGSAGEVVDLFRPAGREVADSVSWAVHVVGIADLVDRRPPELTEGQRKLVEVARALVCEPHFLLLDEPAAGLDVHESRVLGERLRALLELGITVLLVEHDMQLVLGFSDEVLVLDQGRVIASGTPAQVRANADVIAAYLGSDAHERATDRQPTPAYEP